MDILNRINTAKLPVKITFNTLGNMWKRCTPEYGHITQMEPGTFWQVEADMTVPTLNPLATFPNVPDCPEDTRYIQIYKARCSRPMGEDVLCSDPFIEDVMIPYLSTDEIKNKEFRHNFWDNFTYGGHKKSEFDSRGQLTDRRRLHRYPGWKPS